MYNPESFQIDLKELNSPLTTLDLTLDDDFFKAMGGLDVSRGSVNAALSIRKTENFFEFASNLKGTVIIPCTRCLDDMEQPIDTQNVLTIKFGTKYSEENDSVIVPEQDSKIDVSWFLYEYIALSIPIQHVHETGKCNVAMINVLKEHSTTRSGDSGERPVDSRWEKLKELKFDN